MICRVLLLFFASSSALVLSHATVSKHALHLPTSLLPLVWWLLLCVLDQGLEPVSSTISAYRSVAIYIPQVHVPKYFWFSNVNLLRWYVVPLFSGEHHATGTNITFKGTPNGHESTGVRKNKQHEVNHTPSPGQLSVAAAVVFSILGAILVAAVILIVIGVLHKH